MSRLDFALRRQGITGSEIAAVAGVSRYSGPLDVWSRKLGLVPELEQTADMLRGHRLEPALCDWAAEVVGLYPVDVGTLQCPTMPLVIASPDRLLFQRRADDDDPREMRPVEALEVKAPARTMHLWTDPEDDPLGIDPQYLPQVTWEMLAAEVQRVTVAALCYGQLWVYRLTLDPELAGLLVQAAERFWRDHILTRIPPEPTMGADAEVLRRLYPAEKAPLMPWPDGRPDDVITRWSDLDATAKAAQEEADRAKAQVMAEVGEAAGMERPGLWRITWKANKASRKTDWEAVAMGAHAPPGLIEEHTIEKPGARVLRYTDLAAKASKKRME